MKKYVIVRMFTTSGPTIASGFNSSIETILSWYSYDSVPLPGLIRQLGEDQTYFLSRVIIHRARTLLPVTKTRKL